MEPSAKPAGEVQKKRKKKGEEIDQAFPVKAVKPANMSVDMLRSKGNTILLCGVM